MDDESGSSSAHDAQSYQIFEKTSKKRPRLFSDSSISSSNKENQAKNKPHFSKTDQRKKFPKLERGREKLSMPSKPDLNFPVEEEEDSSFEKTFYEVALSAKKLFSCSVLQTVGPNIRSAGPDVTSTPNEWTAAALKRGKNICKRKNSCLSLREATKPVVSSSRTGSCYIFIYVIYII